MNDTALTDKAGNQISVTAGEVRLHLKDGRSLIVGRIYTEAARRIMVTIRKPEKHLFRKLDAYGFNFQVLTELEIDLIKVIEDGSVYLIPVDAINRIGQMDKLNFARQGYELQRFISRADLQQFRIE